MNLTILKRILQGAADDLELNPGDKGLVYLVADRLRRLQMELEGSSHLTERS
jgi:hypothetical protein